MTVMETAPSRALPAPVGVGSPLLGSATMGDGLGTGDGKGDGIGNGEAGQQTPPHAVSVYPAEWIRKPTQAEFRQAWPKAARKGEKSGSVMLLCFILEDGRPRTCSVLREIPADFGFGDAAIALSRTFRIKPIRRDKLIVPDAAVAIPIRFQHTD